MQILGCFFARCRLYAKTPRACGVSGEKAVAGSAQRRRRSPDLVGAVARCELVRKVAPPRESEALTSATQQEQGAESTEQGGGGFGDGAGDGDVVQVGSTP